MAQIRDLIVAGKAKIVGSETVSGLLTADGGLKLGSTSSLATPAYVLSLSNTSSQVTYTNVNELTVDTANKLGTAAAGGTATPIYWKDGKPTALTADVGGAAKPTYLKAGVITACSSTVGSGVKPVFMSSGTITVSSSTAGSTSQPIYLNAGTLTGVTAVGVGYGGTGKQSWTQYQLIYASATTTLSQLAYGSANDILVSGGNSAAPSWVAPSNITVGVASKLGTADKGGATTPIYLAKGVPTACTMIVQSSTKKWFGGLPVIGSDGVMEMGRYIDFHATTDSANDYDVRIDAGTSASKNIVYLPSVTGEVVTHEKGKAQGSGTQFVYVSSTGVITATTSTVASGTRLMYMSSGVMTASTSGVGGTAKPVYLTNGTITACSATVGSGVIPVYMSSGTITASSSNVGGDTRPMYLKAGTMTAITKVGTAYGGTGSTSQTASRLVITDSSGNIVSSGNHYASSSTVCINSTSLPASSANLYVKGSAQIDGAVSLDNKVKF